MISKDKLAAILSSVRAYVRNEEFLEQEDGEYQAQEDDCVLNDAISDCAFRLGLQFETVQRHFNRFLQEEL